MMSHPLTRLAQLDTCAVSDALDKLGLPPAVTGIEPWTSNQRIFGRVRTVRLASAEGRPPARRHLCTAAIERSEPGDVIVVEQRTGIDAAAWGGTLSLGALVRGVAGVIVEGPARDIDESRSIGFAVFARGHTARTARGRILEVDSGGPVEVGDLLVNEGDYVVADGTGVAFVPADELARVLETAEFIVAREQAMNEALRSGTPMSEVMGANYENMLKRD
jgi:regulator of RNase E activity RraA